MKALIVEDDERIALPLKEEFEHQHYHVQLASDGAAGLQLGLHGQFDLILLDLMLPEIDGINVCRRLRQSGCKSVIVMITANDSKERKITGLDCGADDYLAKPFDLDELAARIRAIRRRGPEFRRAILAHAGLLLDQNSCVTTYNQQTIDLTPTEYRLLALFLASPGRTFGKQELIDRLWTDNEVINDNVVKTHIKGLRKKLDSAGAPRELIETVYGLGYRLRLCD